MKERTRFLLQIVPAFLLLFSQGTINTAFAGSPKTAKHGEKEIQLDTMTRLAVIVVVNNGKTRKDKYKAWKSKPQEERDKLRKIFKKWFDKKLTDNERKKLLELYKKYQDKNVTKREFKRFVDKLVKKYGHPVK